MRLIAGIEPSPLDQRDIPYVSHFTPAQLLDVVDLTEHIHEF
jgi:hypothetical protein